MNTELENRLKAMGLSMSCVFVPWSKSRSYDPKHAGDPSRKNLNWAITLSKDGRDILASDYSAGIGHAPSYRDHNPREMGLKNSMLHATFMDFEVETGTTAKTTGFGFLNGAKIEPTLADFLYSILMDGQAIDYPAYEDWADNYGYGRDSRSGEKIYRECIAIGLKLRAALGEPLLAELQEIFQDY